MKTLQESILDKIDKQIDTLNTDVLVSGIIDGDPDYINYINRLKNILMADPKTKVIKKVTPFLKKGIYFEFDCGEEYVIINAADTTNIIKSERNENDVPNGFYIGYNKKSSNPSPTIYLNKNRLPNHCWPGLWHIYMIESNCILRVGNEKLGKEIIDVILSRV